MDADPTAGHDVARFELLADALRAGGINAPQIYARDHENGFLLLEDFGDEDFSRVLEKDPAREPELYRRAVDVLIQLAKLPRPDCPEYGPKALIDALDVAFTDYAGISIGSFLPALDTVFSQIPKDRVLSLRDFHAQNLMWVTPEKTEGSRCPDGFVGVLDFQDAVITHPAYDLVSLLRDARRDVHPRTAREMLSYFQGALDVDRNGFEFAYAALGAQRNLRILGIFARLSRVSGKPQYLSLMPRVWAHLQADLVHPDLAPLKYIIQKHFPDPTKFQQDAIAHR